MEPTEKNPKIDEFLKSGLGIDRMRAVRSNYCALCGSDVLAGSLIDEESRREFRISGMCQECQDEMFGV